MKTKAWVALGAATFLFIIFLGARAQAWTEFRSGNSGTVASNETVDSTLFIGANNVDIAGIVNGDVFCGAQTVNISGTVKGDVICGAQTINISGSVEGNVRLGAQTVNLTGSIGRNATIGAQTINSDSKSRIGNDASFGAENINLNGNIGRDLAVGGSNVNLNGEVGRDIKSAVDKIALSGNAKVGGGIEYTSKNKISLTENAAVAGRITQHQPKKEGRAFPGFLFFTGVMALLAGLILMLSALIITALVPQLVHRVSSQAMRRPWWVLLTGFVASIIAPVLVVLLMITVIGIPLGILLLLSWFLVALTSGLFSAYYVGRRFWTSQRNPLWLVLLGSFTLLVLFMVPYLGFFVMLATFWMGAGMILWELKDRTPKPKYNLK